MEERECTYSTLSDIVSVYQWDQYSQILLVTKSKREIVILILRYRVVEIFTFNLWNYIWVIIPKKRNGTLWAQNRFFVCSNEIILYVMRISCKRTLYFMCKLKNAQSIPLPTQDCGSNITPCAFRAEKHSRSPIP